MLRVCFSRMYLLISLSLFPSSLFVRFFFLPPSSTFFLSLLLLLLSFFPRTQSSFLFVIFRSSVLRTTTRDLHAHARACPTALTRQWKRTWTFSIFISSTRYIPLFVILFRRSFTLSLSLSLSFFHTHAISAPPSHPVLSRSRLRTKSFKLTRVAIRKTTSHR